MQSLEYRLPRDQNIKALKFIDINSLEASNRSFLNYINKNVPKVGTNVKEMKSCFFSENRN